MANLLDTIRGNAQPQQQGVTDETSKLQTLLRAKSGKAVGGSAVNASNLAEQSAVSAANSQIQNEIQPQIQMQQEAAQQQQAGIVSQEEQQRGAINQSRQADDLQTRIRTDQILADLERGKSQLNVEKDKARLEQVGANIRLQDKQYVQKLQQEASLARLQDDASFQEALSRTYFGDAQQLLQKQMGNQSILSANDRQFKEATANMDIDTAYAAMREAGRANAQAGMWQGIGNITTAGIGAYGTYKNSSGGEKSMAEAQSLAQEENANPSSDVNTMKSMKGY